VQRAILQPFRARIAEPSPWPLFPAAWRPRQNRCLHPGIHDDGRGQPSRSQTAVVTLHDPKSEDARIIGGITMRVPRSVASHYPGSPAVGCRLHAHSGAYPRVPEQTRTHARTYECTWTHTHSLTQAHARTHTHTHTHPVRRGFRTRNMMVMILLLQRCRECSRSPTNPLNRVTPAVMPVRTALMPHSVVHRLGPCSHMGVGTQAHRPQRWIP